MDTSIHGLIRFDPVNAVLAEASRPIDLLDRVGLPARDPAGRTGAVSRGEAGRGPGPSALSSPNNGLDEGSANGP